MLGPTAEPPLWFFIVFYGLGYLGLMALFLVCQGRTGAWWQDEMANDAYNPVAMVNYDGNLPDDRVSLFGGDDEDW